MATPTIIQRFIDEAKDAIDAGRELGLTPRQSVEALDDVIEYAENLRAEYADDAARARRARSLIRGGRVRAGR
jgi:hypothetical protein